MNFEEAFRHCQEGTATQEEREFIQNQIAKAKQAMNINFEEAFAHVQQGTATKEELDYVNSRIQAAERALGTQEANAYEKIDDDAKLPPAEVMSAEKEDVKKAKKRFKWRYVTVPVLCLVVVVLILGAVFSGVFGAAAANAKRGERYDRSEVIGLAKDFAVEYINDYCKRKNIDGTVSADDVMFEGDVDSNFEYKGIRHSYYEYYVELKAYAGNYEFKIEVKVNPVSGAADRAKFEIERIGF